MQIEELRYSQGEEAKQAGCYLWLGAPGIFPKHMALFTGIMSCSNETQKL